MPRYHPDETIVAPATPSGPAARGIVRLSGPATVECLRQCFHPRDGDDLAAVRRPRAMVGDFIAPRFTSPAPCEVYLWPGPRSYTGQPLAEIHTIGSGPLLGMMVAALCAAGARLAEPGEFTLRAFLAGRLDLPQAEAVLGVIDAHDREELLTALTQLAGGLSRPLHALRERLLELLAHLEAGLDFVEEDISFLAADELRSQLDASVREVALAREQLRARDIATAELRVVLRGWPNVGKSSLFNALGGGQAIVSAEAGTTRDYLTAEIDIAGRRCLLIDTAGIDPAADLAALAGDAPAAEAQRLAHEEARRADLELLCLDSTRRLNAAESAVLADGASAAPRLVVLTKADQPRGGEFLATAIATSSRTGQGLDALRGAIATQLAANRRGGAAVAATAERCQESLRQAEEALTAARSLADSAADQDLVAAEIRLALAGLGEVVGAVHTDELLDRVFSRFCIGK